MEQHDKRVYVQWQAKAWYDDAASLEYVSTYESVELAKLGPGRKLKFLDNLGSQTTDKYVETTSIECNADCHFLPGGLTSELQVVDAGPGRELKLS